MTTISDAITVQMKEAMKSKDKVRLEALRGIKKVIIEAKTAKAANDELSDADIQKIIAKLAKQNRDSAKIFREQNRADLAEVEEAQAEVMETFLPEPLTEEKIEENVKAIIEKVGASSMADMGKVMGMASKEMAGQADGKVISGFVKKLLS
ncbi:GatB/YqeY domain-containing protein [Halosquirtibacter xylanolyticus]|uniref:GatB/YqeY domain-containing protein n=1 Tax=Halosquirtibacter xylanolyticus TaxID=3374599 RepID=UPI0037483C54|nr:GatB/YqeY domain-containing protein [Prolixibacteraceae bacterium]